LITGPFSASYSTLGQVCKK